MVEINWYLRREMNDDLTYLFLGNPHLLIPIKIGNCNNDWDSTHRSTEWKQKLDSLE